jgi:isopenicillin N synthase-like dioxygenase
MSAAAAAAASTLPFVDLRAYAAGDAAEKARVLETLLRSCEEWGFLLLDGHGLEASSITRTFALAEALFARPAAEKFACTVPESLGNRGYVGFGGERALGAMVADLKEFWHVGQEHVPVGGGAAYLPNVWPVEAAVPGFRAHMLELYTRFEALAALVLHAIEEALALPRDHFASMITGGNSVLRLIHYPPLPADAPAGAIRAAAHEDINLITLLVEGTSGGLELQRRDGSWMPVASLAGQVVVNVGDMLQRATNGRLRSTTHRVANPADATTARYSMPFFVHPRPEVLLDPVVPPGQPQRFDPITAGAFLTERLTAIKAPEKRA